MKAAVPRRLQGFPRAAAASVIAVVPVIGLALLLQSDDGPVTVMMGLSIAEFEVVGRVTCEPACQDHDSVGIAIVENGLDDRPDDSVVDRFEASAAQPLRRSAKEFSWCEAIPENSTSTRVAHVIVEITRLA